MTFEGVIESSDGTSDIAIDNVTVAEGSCSGKMKHIKTNPAQSSRYDCKKYLLWEAAWPSGQRTPNAAVPGASPVLTTTWICFSVARSSNPGK